ncbi:hypothetical protein Patl1_13260 [Pistacia atlantica]|uniref:Uncharacterized protein n=1 Tax=Pistacia atlantica TaxID=434234 RepID=A0ACC1AYE9_9ROSI|nr:hypothetical protein Patl1_13260 [Pistacia atlantica]
MAMGPATSVVEDIIFQIECVRAFGWNINSTIQTIKDAARPNPIPTSPASPLPHPDLQNEPFTTSRVPHVTPMMATNHPPCKTRPPTTPPPTPPPIPPMDATPGSHPPADSPVPFVSPEAGRGNDKGWPECKVIEEEGDCNDYYSADKGYSRRCQIMIGVVAFVLVFSVFCLIIWGASRPYKAQITVKSLSIHNFYLGVGADTTGVPTKMLTLNCSMKMNVYNPATFFGIHLSATPVNLMFSEITVATGELKKYYQPRKSHRVVNVNLKGNKIPLYGAGSSLLVSDNSGAVPVVLVFEVRQRGNVVGKLVRSRHRKHISCSLLIDSRSNKPIKLKKDSCTYT